MNINVNFFDGMTEEVIIEVQLGNQVVERTQMPLIFAKQQFLNILNQIMNDSRPMKITCLRSEYTESGKKLENSLTFKNMAFVRGFGEDL